VAVVRAAGRTRVMGRAAMVCGALYDDAVALVVMAMDEERQDEGEEEEDAVPGLC
jgi:hypothetical protein